MAKKQQQQQRLQQQQDSQQQPNHYAAPKPNPTPVVQLRSQQWSTPTNQPAGTSLQPQQNQSHVVKQQQQQQFQQIISKPPSKPPRKFNLDTLSRVIEEDEEELQALIREEIARKNGKSMYFPAGLLSGEKRVPIM